METSLDNLIRIDGFDNKYGEVDIESWKEIIDFCSKKLNIIPGESIFEIGCGAGAFLYPFYQKITKLEG